MSLCDVRWPRGRCCSSAFEPHLCETNRARLAAGAAKQSVPIRRLLETSVEHGEPPATLVDQAKRRPHVLRPCATRGLHDERPARPQSIPFAEYAQPIASARSVSYTHSHPPPGALVTIGFSMNRVSSGTGLRSPSRFHGPPSTGADARPTSQCSMGITSVRALP